MENKELKAAYEFLEAQPEQGVEWVEKANALLPFCRDKNENLYRTAARIINNELEKKKKLIEEFKETLGNAESFLGSYEVPSWLSVDIDKLLKDKTTKVG